MVRQIKLKFSFSGGQIIIELLVAFGLAGILLPALLTGLVGARSGKVQQQERVQAIGLLKEAEEATRSVREANWSNITSPTIVTGSPYHPVVSSGSWSLVSGEETLGDFTRSIVFSDLTPPDPSLKQVDITVSWGDCPGSCATSTLYLARWRNIYYADDTHTVSESGGGFGNWCQPVGPSVTNVDLNRQGHPTILKAFETPGGIDGNRVLAGTGANASGPAFSFIKIAGNSPPTATPLADYNGTPQAKVNGLFGDPNSNFVFLAADNPVGVAILDVSLNPYQQVGSFKPGNENVRDVYVVGDTGYAVTDTHFYVFGISSDRTTTTQTDSLALNGGVKIYVDPNSQYAYVASSDTGGQLKIIDIHSHPGSLSSTDVKSFAVDGGAGRDVIVNATGIRAYLATAASTTQPEFFIIDISDKANPSVVPNGTYDTNGMDPYGIAIVSGPRGIIVGTGGHEYQVFSLEGDQVSFCPNHSQGNDFLDIDSGVFSIASVSQTDGHAYSYIATGDSNAEIKIVEGGAGGGIGGGGVFESETLPIPDPGHDVVFNNFTATSDPDLSYEISIKKGVSGNCLGVTYTDSDFVSFAPGPLPRTTIGSGYVNPGQCLRYRVINSGSTPKQFIFSFNYSP